MIRKFFIVGKQLYLQSKKLEPYNELGKVIELEMPIQMYWEMDELLKKANYLLSAGEETPEVLSQYRKIFKLSSRFAIFEKDRSWLIERSKGDG